MINVGYDVVIAGAGPTGLALAGELAHKDLKVLVLERWPTCCWTSHRRTTC